MGTHRSKIQGKREQQNTCRHNPKKKQKQTINQNQVKKKKGLTKLSVVLRDCTSKCALKRVC
jgi:hypothetical protein